jgi:hypothetical protein
MESAPKNERKSLLLSQKFCRDDTRRPKILNLLTVIPFCTKFNKVQKIFKFILYSKFLTITGTKIFTAYRAKVPKLGKPFRWGHLLLKNVKTCSKRDENGLESNGSCATALVKSFRLTPAPQCPGVHEALEPSKAGNGQLLFFGLVPICPPYESALALFRVTGY